MPTGHTDAEMAEIFRQDNKFRKSMGLRVIKQGWIPCCQCDTSFFSQDLKIDRRCPRCEAVDQAEEYACEVSVPETESPWMIWNPEGD